MNRIGRLMIIFVALACGAASAIIALPILSFVDPATREAGIFLFMASIMSSISVSSGPEDAAGTLMLLVRTVTLAFCVLPLVVASLVGEVARVRSWFWYACCSGVIAAAMPWILRLGVGHGARSESASASTIEIRFVLLFFFTGLIAGTVYWLIAGRSAGVEARETRGVVT